MNTSGCSLLVGTALAIAAMVPAAAEDQAASVKRGEYLLNGPVACANCHTPRGPDFSFLPGMDYAGGLKQVDPGYTTYSANITPDRGTGIDARPDQEIITAIREGNVKGIVFFPPMPVRTYNNMSDEDVKAIVAYLRTIKPVRHFTQTSTWKIVQPPMPAAKGLPAPPMTDKVAYGGYIVNSLAACFECHSTRGADTRPDLDHHLGAGGFEIELAPGEIVRTPNITPDPETGIELWSDADIKTAITEGVTSGGQHLSPPMPFAFYKNMTPEDLDAIVAYLRTVPPIRNEVERTDFQKSALP
jgi:mono/diheme cytochrome c family protein